MALGDPYVSLPELKIYASVDRDDEDGMLNDAIDAASRGIELVCDRQFNDAGAGPLLPRVFAGEGDGVLEVDDFSTTVGLVVRVDSGDGSFGTTLAATDYELHPLNGIVAGVPGWPYSELWEVGGHEFTRRTGRASVEVTARWGWAGVPAPVKEACYIVATELYKTKDAPFGIYGSNEQYGAVRVRENPLAMRKLQPYMKTPVLVA